MRLVCVSLVLCFLFVFVFFGVFLFLWCFFWFSWRLHAFVALPLAKFICNRSGQKFVGRVAGSRRRFSPPPDLTPDSIRRVTWFPYVMNPTPQRARGGNRF